MNINSRHAGGLSIGHEIPLVVQPDGKILIGGYFTTLAPNGGAVVTRNRIARLNPDSTLDTYFNPNANAVINAIAVQADGKILKIVNYTGHGSVNAWRGNLLTAADWQLISNRDHLSLFVNDDLSERLLPGCDE